MKAHTAELGDTPTTPDDIVAQIRHLLRGLTPDDQLRVCMDVLKEDFTFVIRSCEDKVADEYVTKVSTE